jgi:hypothetical protein
MFEEANNKSQKSKSNNGATVMSIDQLTNMQNAFSKFLEFFE